MANQQKEVSGDGFFDAMGCMIFPLCVVVGFLLLLALSEENKKNLQKEKHTIEGVISKIESYNVDPPEPKEDEKRQSTVYVGPLYVRERTKIIFTDGRFKEFSGVLSKPLNLNKYYIITYNGLNQVVDFVEK